MAGRPATLKQTALMPTVQACVTDVTVRAFSPQKTMAPIMHQHHRLVFSCLHAHTCVRACVSGSERLLFLEDAYVGVTERCDRVFVTTAAGKQASKQSGRSTDRPPERAKNVVAFHARPHAGPGCSIASITVHACTAYRFSNMFFLFACMCFAGFSSRAEKTRERCVCVCDEWSSCMHANGQCHAFACMHAWTIDTGTATVHKA